MASGELSGAAIRASLRNSIKDGVAWSVMVGAGERYVRPFVILGGSSLLGLATIVAVPALAGAVVQWLAANVTDAFRCRKAIFVWTAVLQALVWAPMAVAIFLPPPWGYGLMLGGFVAYLALANFGVPAWTSVMGDLVPADARGRYFGLRNMLVGLAVILSFFGAGWWLTWSAQAPALRALGGGPQQFGFLMLFALAGAARLLSAWYLHRMHEPPYRRQASDDFSLWDFIRRAPRAHFGRFVFYSALIQIGGGATTPFLDWYLLRQLGCSTMEFAGLFTVQMLALYGFSPLVGRIGDRLGSKRVLGAGGLTLVAVPPLLMASTHPAWLAAVQVLDGAAWAAFSISAANYLYDIVTPAKRARCIAYYTLFIALSAAAGSFLFAAVAQFVRVPVTLAGLTVTQPYVLILLCVLLVRLAANLLLLRSFREWRLVRVVATQPCSRYGAPAASDPSRE